MSQLQLGVCEWALPVTGPFAVRLAAEMGFQGLQLADGGGPKMQYPLCNKRVQQGYLEAAQQYGMTLHSVHTRSMFQDKTIDAPGGSALSDMAKECLNKTIQACEAMGIATVMCTAVIRQPEGEAFSNVAAHLRYGCQVAKHSGVTLTLETNMANADIFRMREAVGEDLRLCFDTCNPYIYNTGNPQEMLRETLVRAPGFIQHYHVKDTRKEEFLMGRPAPILVGTGDSGIRETAAIIRQSGFGGWVHSESYYFARPINDGGDFVEIAKADCAAIKQIFTGEEGVE